MTNFIKFEIWLIERYYKQQIKLGDKRNKDDIVMEWISKYSFKVREYWSKKHPEDTDYSSSFFV